MGEGGRWMDLCGDTRGILLWMKLYYYRLDSTVSSNNKTFSRPVRGDNFIRFLHLLGCVAWCQ